MLSSVSVFFILVFSFLNVFVGVTQDTIELKGYFFVKKFTNKGGKKTDFNEFYFRSGGEYYLIKNCESKKKIETKNHLEKAIVLATIKEGSIDICDENSMAQSRIGKYIVINKSITESNFGFTLCDQSGNCIILKNDTLLYNPVTPILSSSGIYSGGESKEKIISRNDRIWIVRSFKRMLKRTHNELYYSRKKGEYYIEYDGIRGNVKLISKDLKKWDKFKNTTLKRLN